MNKMIKIGFSTLAFAAILSAQAGEDTPAAAPAEYEGAIGWTPIAVGLASPVQLPWGIGEWDIFGVDLNLLYSDQAKKYGLGVAGLVNRTRDHMAGAEVAALCNWASYDTYGVCLTVGANICNGTGYGVDVALGSYRRDFWGLDVSALAAIQENMWGMQVAGLATVTDQQTYGWTTALLTNLARKAYGLQLAAAYNMTDELHGCQIALVNYADECVWGFQIGLLNIIMSNSLKFLPIVNAYF